MSVWIASAALVAAALVPSGCWAKTVLPPCDDPSVALDLPDTYADATVDPVREWLSKRTTKMALDWSTLRRETKKGINLLSFTEVDRNEYEVRCKVHIGYDEDQERSSLEKVLVTGRLNGEKISEVLIKELVDLFLTQHKLAL